MKNVSNDEAVAILKKTVSKLGPITLVVAKHCWLRSLKPFNGPLDETNEDTLNLRDQPVRPIDPKAWVEHTRQVNSSSKGKSIDLSFFFFKLLNIFRFKILFFL